jgi:hypothetical protein
MSSYEPVGAATQASADYTALDDSTLIARRREIRERLEREPPDMADLVRAHYLLTTEVLRRTFALRRLPA